MSPSGLPLAGTASLLQRTKNPRDFNTLIPIRPHRAKKQFYFNSRQVLQEQADQGGTKKDMYIFFHQIL
jgi:hypothetical protein